MRPGDHLAGRVALVTGVSRRIGIAHTVAERLAAAGAVVVRAGWPAADAEQEWGADADPLPGVRHVDFEDPSAPAALIDAVVAEHGAIDIVLAVHARSSDHTLADTTATELDRCFAINVRSAVLLAQRFAERHDPSRFPAGRPGGRMIWFTSGQHKGAMYDTVPYAVSKGALHQMTATLAVPLGERGIVANSINPGPVDTGWATGELHGIIAERFPAGRWGTPDDVANLVEFLVSDEGGWINGQVIDSEGGFRR